MPTTKNFERRTPRATSVASSASGGNPIGGFVKNLFGGGGQQSNISNLLFGPQKNIFQQIAGVLPSAPQAPSGMGELATLGYMKGARQNKWVSGAKALLGGIGSGQQMVQERQQRQQASSMLEQAGMEVTGFKWDTKNQKMVPTFGSKAKGILEQKKYELDLRKQESKEQGELSKALVEEDEKAEKRKIEGEKRRIAARQAQYKTMKEMYSGIKMSPKLARIYATERSKAGIKPETTKSQFTSAQLLESATRLVDVEMGNKMDRKMDKDGDVYYVPKPQFEQEYELRVLKKANELKREFSKENNIALPKTTYKLSNLISDQPSVGIGTSNSMSPKARSKWSGLWS